MDCRRRACLSLPPEYGWSTTHGESVTETETETETETTNWHGCEGAVGAFTV